MKDIILDLEAIYSTNKNMVTRLKALVAILIFHDICGLQGDLNLHNEFTLNQVVDLLNRQVLIK